MKLVHPAADPWHALCGEDGPQPHPSPCNHALLSLEQWHAVRQHWPVGLQVGVALANTVDVQSMESDLPRLALLTLDFPKWTDGRAYSQARLLRARLRFSGEIRATGDVVVDMLPLLRRTGFDAATLRVGQKAGAAQQALRYFAGHYQGDVSRPQPLFQRAPQ